MARPEAMGVDPLADPHRPRGAGDQLGHGEILRIGEFHQHRVAGDQHNLAARGFHNRGVVGGGIVLGPSGVGGDQVARSKGLRGLGPPQSLARRGHHASGGVLALERIGHGQGGHGAVRAFQRFDEGDDVR